VVPFTVALDDGDDGKLLKHITPLDLDNFFMLWKILYGV
jgi:hypothetical protein